ncbi:hypothetical protein BGW36DRAFT_395225 [Talaromyces proteolyticus]|uniref:25S rRNA (uridine-N(3))-methyltransferase BMT5-like domain-containing protein n=1 Tax=Talaromyces proteolyticus TaxID=1131652 RepID=A0AAD4Q4F8_9EURO|nr:uncharacterized protein BGW36DRAFT_395225 [Talaromyces proteolyticus]KAH8702622.1 hypothetical protein BGW36DRAFT_395225 [Talaromyces proteolyticus]
MTKSKNKSPHPRSQKFGSQGDIKKRKMQHFERISISSSSITAKKRKFEGDTTSELGKDKKQSKNNHQQELHQRPTIPYQRTDRILLIGEGDFSFARSLVEHRRCKRVFATCFDSKEELFSKYSKQVEANVEAILHAGKHLGSDEREHDKDEVANAGKPAKSFPMNDKPSKNAAPKVMYSVDARKLGTPAGGGREIRHGIHTTSKKQPGGHWDIISFNFPHIGGKSTDMNRQVRANQELLVAFFKACVPLLSTSIGHVASSGSEDSGYEDPNDPSRYNTNSEDEDEMADTDDEPPKENIRTVPRQSGQIVVTLFEGEPYTLWNIKDLARHAGLTVVTSFRFPWKSYPEYSHARTLGIVESRCGKTGGGWKGENRDARTYVFEVKSEDGRLKQSAGKKKKKKEDTSDEDD